MFLKNSLKVIKSVLHHTARKLNLGSTIYVLSHYVAGVILFGKREEVRRQTMSKVIFLSGTKTKYNSMSIVYKLAKCVCVGVGVK